MLLKNESKKSVSVRTSNGWVTFQPKEEFDLPEQFKYNVNLVEVLNDDEPKEIKEDIVEEVKEEELAEAIVESKKSVEGLFSKTDLMDLKKKEQVSILEGFGLDKKEIKILKKEESRVKKILQLQELNK